MTAKSAMQTGIVPAASPGERKNMLERVVALTAIILAVVFSFAIDGFATLGNLRVILTNSASLAILSCGMAVVIVSRGLDLSLIAQMIAGALVFSYLVIGGTSAGIAMLVALGVMLLLGVMNAWLIAYVEIPSMLATLASSMFITGLFRNTILDGGFMILLPRSNPAVAFLSGALLPGPQGSPEERHHERCGQGEPDREEVSGRYRLDEVADQEERRSPHCREGNEQEGGDRLQATLW